MAVFDLSAERVRPQAWDDYVGQEELKGRLDVMIQAAQRDDRMLDHMLLIAPPGTGKTTLATLIADRLGVDFEYFKAPVKENHFLDVLSLCDDAVVMIDEIHNASKAFQEMLQPALEDGRIQITPSYAIDTSRITFIGATVTTFRDKILEPLRDRFEVKPAWASYSDEEMALIIEGMSQRMGVEMPSELAKDLARATGGTPRLAKPLVKRARDLMEPGRVVTAEDVLTLVGVDADGLEHLHWQYLRCLEDLGGRAGLRNLANILRLSAPTIEDLERLLALRGFIRYESNGRHLTPQGRRKLHGSNARAKLTQNS